MACIRGSRIYDSPQTKNMVQKWIKFYKVSNLSCAFIIKNIKFYYLAHLELIINFIYIIPEVPRNSTR